MKLAELNDAITAEDIEQRLGVMSATVLFDSCSPELAELLAEIILRMRRLEAAQQDARLTRTDAPTPTTPTQDPRERR